MRWRHWLFGSIITSALLAPAIPADAPKSPGVPAAAISWKKTVIDTKFRSEGVAIADVNKDGKMDILTGEWWFEAPDWKPHAIRPAKADYTEGDKNVYSQSFCCWTEDLNGDGYPDLIVIRFPGQPCYWYENPKGGTGLWKEHLIWDNACNETPQFADLFGTGKRVLIMGVQPKGKGGGNAGQMAWFAPGSDPTQPWEMHAISEPSIAPTVKDGKPVAGTGKIVPGTFMFSHGLGIGDVNGDGRQDVICTDGWWEQPSKVTDQPWKFHPAALGPACADMFAFDLDGDGKMDILSSSAHQFGIWAHLQKDSANGEPRFLRTDLFKNLLSETHAMHFVDINGDGLKDLVTGKRWHSHGRQEPGSNDPAMIYWFEAKKNKDGLTSFVPHVIDNDSGIGTQFVVADFNGDGLLDIITSNKKGTFLIEQLREKAK
jgi:hypothetical protein